MKSLWLNTNLENHFVDNSLILISFIFNRENYYFRAVKNVLTSIFFGTMVNLFKLKNLIVTK